VIDETTGKAVGVIMYWGDQQRLISLFDDKYTGLFLTNEECIAFAKGVEEVINHLISTGEGDEAAGLGQSSS
jgi:hypothetical protein